MKETEKSGPGEIISEIAQGLRNAVARKEISTTAAQDLFNMAQREMAILATAYPSLPWETGSTQVEPLKEEAKRINGGRLFTYETKNLP